MCSAPCNSLFYLKCVFWIYLTVYLLLAADFKRVQSQGGELFTISVLCFLFNFIDIYTLPSLNFDTMAILTLYLGKFTISGIGVAFRLILKSIGVIDCSPSSNSISGNVIFHEERLAYMILCNLQPQRVS